MTEGDLLTADNQTSTSWRDGISEEFRSGVAKFDSIDALAKSYGELERSMGGRVKIPTDESSVEEKSAFYEKLGRPKTSDGYTLPEGDVNKDIFTGWATIAHEVGMSDAQFSTLAKKYIELEAQRKEADVAEFNRHREESDRKLHEDYGADYDKNIELSKRAYTEYANDELKALLDTDKYVGLRNEPSFIDMMVQIGIKNMDDTFVKGEGQVEKPVDDFVPASPNSPEMYEHMDGEIGAKSRAYFRKKGYQYARSD